MRKLAVCLWLLLLAAAAGAQRAGPISLNTLNQCATIPVSSIASSTVAFSVSGTWVGTLQPNVQIQGQAWTAVQVTPSSSSTAQSTIVNTAQNGNYTAPVTGFDNFQVCMSAYTSGTAVVYFNISTARNGRGGGGGGGGSGTVTSVACGTGLTCSPSPITSSGTISLTGGSSGISACSIANAISSYYGTPPSSNLECGTNAPTVSQTSGALTLQNVVTLAQEAPQMVGPPSSAAPVVPTATSGTCTGGFCSNDSAVACTASTQCNLNIVFGASQGSGGYGVAGKTFLNWVGLNTSTPTVTPGDCLAFDSVATSNSVSIIDSTIPCGQAPQTQVLSTTGPSIQKSNFALGIPAGVCRPAHVSFTLDTFAGSGSCTLSIQPQVYFTSCYASGSPAAVTTYTPTATLTPTATSASNQVVVSQQPFTVPIYALGGTSVGVGLIWNTPGSGCVGAGVKFTPTFSID